MKYILSVLLLISVPGKAQTIDTSGLFIDTTAFVYISDSAMIFTDGDITFTMGDWSTSFHAGDTVITRDSRGMFTEIFPDSLAAITYLWNYIHQQNETMFQVVNIPRYYEPAVKPKKTVKRKP